MLGLLNLVPWALLLAAFLAVSGALRPLSDAAGDDAAANGADPAGAEGARTVVVATGPEGPGSAVEIRAEVADTEAEWERGLMGRPPGSLARDAGMLFVFDRERRLTFWMKGTRIPLSVAFIDSEGRIVDIQDMQPLDTTDHPSAEPARYALEVNRGFFEGHGVEVGDRIASGLEPTGRRSSPQPNSSSQGKPQTARGPRRGA